MTGSRAVLDRLETDRRQVETALHRCLPPEDADPRRLHEAMRYAVFAGGKRLRPLLVLSGCRACEGRIEDMLDVAAAMELIHTYSLVHDDLPPMDDDVLRRGKPTTHVVYGEALAILVGDALFTRAFELIASINSPDRGDICARVARATGSCGMVGGQVLDLEAEHHPLDRSALENVHRLKTGRLITTCVIVGGLGAGARPESIAALETYGNALGLSFQIVDDILDVTSSDERLGKSAGKDARAGKATFPSLIGLDGSRREADRLVAEALDAVAPFGVAADPLRYLARFVRDRDH